MILARVATALSLSGQKNSLGRGYGAAPITDWFNPSPLALAAGGQRPTTLRLRKAQLCVAARGLDSPPGEVTAENLVNWLGRQQHLSPEARHSYRNTPRGFFVWMYEVDRVAVGDALPRVWSVILGFGFCKWAMLEPTYQPARAVPVPIYGISRASIVVDKGAVREST